MFRVGAFLLLLVLPAASEAAKRPRLDSRESSCEKVIDSKWTAPERFVWRRVCLGEFADFNQKSGSNIDPTRPEGLPDDRVVSATFLKTIMRDEGYRNLLTHQGVRIGGARFDQRLDLENFDLKHELWVVDSQLKRGAMLGGLKSTQTVSLAGSILADTSLDLYGVQIDGDLRLQNGFAAKEVNLALARIGRDLEVSASSIQSLRIDGAKINGNAWLNNRSAFGSLSLVGANIIGSLSLEGSKVEGLARLDGLVLGSSLFMSEMRASKPAAEPASPNVEGAATSGNKDNVEVVRSEFAAINLSGAQIRGALEVTGSKIAQQLRLDGIRIDGNLLINNAEVGGEANLTRATIGGSIVLDNSKFDSSIGMDGIKLSGNLQMIDASFVGGSFRGASIGGDVDLSGARAGAFLWGNGLKLTGNLEMTRISFVEGNFQGASVGGDMVLADARIGRMLMMDGLKVGGHLVMIGSSEGAAFLGDISLRGAQVGGANQPLRRDCGRPGRFRYYTHRRLRFHGFRR